MIYFRAFKKFTFERKETKQDKLLGINEDTGEVKEVDTTDIDDSSWDFFTLDTKPLVAVYRKTLELYTIKNNKLSRMNPDTHITDAIGLQWGRISSSLVTATSYSIDGKHAHIIFINTKTMTVVKEYCDECTIPNTENVLINLYTNPIE